MAKAKTRGGVTVTNLADDGKRPKPFAKLEIPIRRLGKHEMALHEEMGDGTLGDTKFSFHRTFDGHFWLYIGDDCFVIAWEDIITSAIAKVESNAEAKAS